MWLSARWAGAFTPLLVAWVLSMVSWRWAFVLFGGIGVIWALFFYRWFRDHPRNHPGVNAAELRLLADAQKNAQTHGSVPWRKDRKSTRLNSSHTEIYTLSLHDALPICCWWPGSFRWFPGAGRSFCLAALG